MHYEIAQRIILVTGGGSGIGRSCAMHFAGASALVAVADIREDLGLETVALIEESGGRAAFVQCDVSSAAQVQAMIDAVTRQFGRIDVAVNNAGVYREGADDSYPKERWDEVIATNLTGTWMCAQAEMRQMVQQSPMGGKIINIASIGAHRAISNGAYDASKAAVVHLTRTLAARWGRFNINVNSVSPGYVDMVFGHSRHPDEQKRLRDMTPLARNLRCEDLNGPIHFLASDASAYVTGQDIIVDGGHTLSTWMIPP